MTPCRSNNSTSPWFMTTGKKQLQFQTRYHMGRSLTLPLCLQTIYCDHKPLLFAFCQKTDKFSPRQSISLEFLAQFSTDIRHVSGDSNAVADAFSRIDEIHLPVEIDFDTMAKEQKSDSCLESLMRTSSGLEIKPIKLSSGAELMCDVSICTIRPYVLKNFGKTAFDSIHSFSHSVGKAMVK
ncbi:hypothetical protein AVEN_61557-1 [Araneus ventricosus]|uniref:Reverse transcriptase RNase H-like domain-containing protein n=1 Tax=Araneus ventricosus TaxID=182803 RepID=A0A4Y2MIK3_ARAVE|nr:hypothetical protein AVEN_61557-1 [Araneus ventricosus]